MQNPQIFMRIVQDTMITALHKIIEVNKKEWKSNPNLPASAPCASSPTPLIPLSFSYLSISTYCHTCDRESQRCTMMHTFLSTPTYFVAVSPLLVTLTSITTSTLSSPIGSSVLNKVTPHSSKLQGIQTQMTKLVARTILSSKELALRISFGLPLMLLCMF